MANNPAVPFFDEGNAFTAQASAAVTGKRFVNVSGARVGEQVQVGPATAAARPLGVAAFDAAVGELVTVYSSPGIVVPVTAGGSAISAGAVVEVGAGGVVVVLAAGIAVGKLLDDVAANGDAMVKLI